MNALMTKSQLFITLQDIGNPSNFLWIQKNNDDVKNSIARIVSPIYQNSRSDCTLRFRYYISGNLNNKFIKPALHPVGSEVEIVLDYLRNNNAWKSYEIGIGRRRGEFQVKHKKIKCL